MWREKNEIAVNVIKIIMIGLTILSFIKGIWVSLDIDESYAVALGYRLARGDRLIRDMWEPHQFSAFLAALFTAPYIWIRGNTDYLVIYLRIAGTLIHTGIGIVLYKRLCKTFNKLIAFGIMVLHLNYLPKWVQMPEFELIHYWCLLGIFLSLYTYFTDEKQRMILLFLSGALLTLSMLCYPTMIFLYPFYAWGIYVLERQFHSLQGSKAWLSSLFFTFGVLLVGIVILGHLFSYMSLEEFRKYISYILLDTSHSFYTTKEKWSIYLKELQEQGKDYLSYLQRSSVIFTIIYLGHRFGALTVRKQTEERKPALYNIVIVISMVLLLTGILIQADAIYGNLFEDQNQFFLQIRYIAVILPALILGICYYHRMSLWLHLCVIPGVISIPAVLLMTNMDTNVTYAKAFIAVLGSFLIFHEFGREILTTMFWKKAFLVLQCAVGGMVLAGLLVCRLLLIRVSGCLPVTVLAPLEKMTAGPEAGIFILEDTAKIWNDNYYELNQYISEDDKLLYIGAENLVYVKTEALPATPSTQGTTVYNEMYLYYYEEHPERLPDVIVFDKTFQENPVYAISFSFSLQSQLFFDWIRENYGDSRIVETENLIILRKE